MAKITLNNLANLQNETSAVNIINTNNDAIETAMENTLSRDGTAPNQMGANLDMNSNRILNLAEPVSDTEPVRLTDLEDIVLTSGSGNVVGPVSAVSNNLAMFAGTSGKIIADSSISKTNPTFAGNLSVGGNTTVTGTTTSTGAVTGNNGATLIKNGSGSWPLNLSNNSTTSVDYIRLLAPGVANADKFIRSDLLGNFQILDSGYTQAILTLSDTGALSVPGSSNGNMAADTVKGRLGTSGASSDLSKTQLTSLINPVTSSLSGAAPASGGGTLNYLRADGTWNIPPGSRQLLNTLTASNSANLQDTTSLTSTYSRYEIEFSNLVNATSTVGLCLRIQSGGSFKTSGYQGSAIGSAAANNAQTTFIPLSDNGGLANPLNGFSGMVTLVNPSANAVCMAFGQSGTVSASSAFVSNFAGAWVTAGVVTGFQILFTSGNITSGTVKVYGIV